MKAKYWRYLFLACVSIPLSMLVVFIIVFILVTGDWQPVEAEVLSTNIEISRPGTLAWSLMVDYHYSVDDEWYDHTHLDVFRHEDRNVTLVEQEGWPVGSKFTIYYNLDNPKKASLSSDGGREVTAVIFSIFTPAVMFFIWALIVHLRRRARAS